MAARPAAAGQSVVPPIWLSSLPSTRFLFDALQLYARNLGSIDEEPRRPPRGRTQVHRVSRREAKSSGTCSAHTRATTWEAPATTSRWPQSRSRSAAVARCRRSRRMSLLTVEKILDALGRAQTVARRVAERHAVCWRPLRTWRSGALCASGSPIRAHDRSLPVCRAPRLLKAVECSLYLSICTNR